MNNIKLETQYAYVVKSRFEYIAYRYTQDLVRQIVLRGRDLSAIMQELTNRDYLIVNLV